MRTMNELSLHFLQDIYDAEKRSLRTLQKMSRAATGEALRTAFSEHRTQSEGQIGRLEQVFEQVTGKRPRGKACAAMIGLIKEVDEAIDEGEKGAVLDAALIACAQAIDHYEIARYGAMAAWAEQLGHPDVAEMLRQNLEEERHSDQMLTELAERESNPEAAEGSAGEEDEEAEAAPAPKRRGRPPGSGAKKAEAEAPAPAAPAKAAPSRAAAKPAAAKSTGRGRRKAEPAPEPEPEPAPAPKPRGRRRA